MASDGEEEFDADDGFEADMESLRRACILAGESPNRAEADLSGGDTAASAPCSPDADEGDDDIELFRDIQNRFALSSEVQAPLDIEALSSTFPTDSGGGDDGEDDLEALRAIQRRFSSYADDDAKEELDTKLHEPVQVGVTNKTSEEESCNKFFLDRTNAGEGFPTSVDGHYSALQISEACSGLGATVQSGDLSLWNNVITENACNMLVGSSNFPQSAQAFVDAIKKNRALQKVIRSKMMHIETRVAELNKLKGWVKIFRGFQVSCRRKTSIALAQKNDARVQLISTIRQKVNPKLNERKCSPMYYAPPENSTVSSYREALAKFPVSVKRERWSEDERVKLLSGIKQQFQEVMFHRSVDLISDVDGSFGDLTDIDSNISSIRGLDITPEMMRLFLPKVNWDHLASMFLPKRTGSECQTRWLNFEDPLINKGSWAYNNPEEKNLLHIIQQKGLNNWIDIAISLGTNRTPFQCLARYQRSLNASIIKSKWTEEEDNKLRAAVEVFGESNWQAVAALVEERTGNQCSNRWIKSLNPARKRVGQWTANEDKCLKVAVMLFGNKSWKKVAQYVPGRTHVQCRERWVNSLDPSLNMNQWTEEEDLKLGAAIDEHGYQWSKVAACVAPRTDSQCRRRWQVLSPGEIHLLRQARKLQNVAFISNFVDRENERPSLKPDDFTSAPLPLTVSRSETRGKRKIIPKYEIAPSKSLSHFLKTMDAMELQNGKDVTPKSGKRRKRRSNREMCTDDGTCPPFAAGLSSNDNEPGGQELGFAKKNRKASKLPPRKKGKCGHNEDVPEIFATDEMEATFGEGGVIFKKSTMKSSRKGNKKTCSRKKCSDSSSIDRVGKDDGQTASLHHAKGALQELSLSQLDTDLPEEEHFDSSLSFEANADLESGDILVEESLSHSLQMRQFAGDVLDTRCSGSDILGKRKRHKGKNVARSIELGIEVEEEDSTTLATFLQKSGNYSNHSAPATVTKQNSNLNAISVPKEHTSTAALRCSEIQEQGIGIRLGNTIASAAQGDIEDEMPLAHFFNKLKRRRLELLITGSNPG
ncbi:unnamed protein product [Cuscuta epithymum]|uniref:Uncharacterized protein n=2 Tax=Cuscuta epithymum TaxID=186058 RepID=A0AAV0FLC2_9ASTE|nr:unnamed protein product [Cuscuta epithymum]